MSNEELATLIQAGERDKLLELWGQIRRFALQQARRWAYLGRGGVTLEDLEQAAFLALMEALEGWKPEAGSFLTWYGLWLKAEFTQATGQRTKRERLDPLDMAESLDIPLGESEEFTLCDAIADPQAESAIETVGEWDALHRAVEHLPEVLRKTVFLRYYGGLTLEQVAGRLNMSKNTASRTEQKAMRLLRHPTVSRTRIAHL